MYLTIANCIEYMFGIMKEFAQRVDRPLNGDQCSRP